MAKSKKKRRLFGRDLSDTAFSIERLFIWAIGIYGLIGMLAIAAISIIGVVQHREITIPPQLQSATMFSIGAIAARIERKIND